MAVDVVVVDGDLRKGRSAGLVLEMWDGRGRWSPWGLRVALDVWRHPWRRPQLAAVALGLSRNPSLAPTRRHPSQPRWGWDALAGEPGGANQAY